MNIKQPSDWEAHYLAGDTPWDKGEPSPGLLDFLSDHPGALSGRVLVPGCGTGHDARAWANAGFHVTGLDIAPTAASRASSQHPGMNPVFQTGDFLEDSPEVPFDVIFEHTLFCAIDPSHRAAYEKAIHRWLAPGGTFLAVHYMLKPEPDGPPFGVTQQELWERFAPGLEFRKAWIPRAYPNRTGLELMFWWTKPAR